MTTHLYKHGHPVLAMSSQLLQVNLDIAVGLLSAPSLRLCTIQLFIDHAAGYENLASSASLADPITIWT